MRTFNHHFIQRIQSEEPAVRVVVAAAAHLNVYYLREQVPLLCTPIASRGGKSIVAIDCSPVPAIARIWPKVSPADRKLARHLLLFQLHLLDLQPVEQ